MTSSTPVAWGSTTSTTSRRHIERQIVLALDEADLILFVVDALSGLVPLDQEIAIRLRSINKTVVLVANKCDSHRKDADAEEFQQLGYGD